MTDMQTDTIKRPVGRPPLPRDPVRAPVEDHKARAAERLAEIRAVQTAEPPPSTEIFPVVPPDGWSYEAKRWSIYNKEDPQYLSSLMHRWWSPVPASRHPELTYAGYIGDTIIKDGLILMERPKVITDEARRKENQESRAQVAAKEQAMAGAKTAMGTEQRVTAHERKIRPMTVEDIT